MKQETPKEENVPIQREYRNEQIFSKCQSDLYKSLDNVSRGVFRTHSGINDGAFQKNK